MKTIRKVISMVIVLSMVIGICAGCASKEGAKETTVQDQKTVTESTAEASTDTAGSADELEWKGDTSPFSFEAWMGYSWAKGSYDVYDTPVAKLIQQKTGVTWKYTIPPGQESEALNLMIASRSYPDMIVTDYTNENVNKLIEGGLVYSYSELIDKYCPKMWSLITSADKLYYTQPDGKLYYIPNYQADSDLPKTSVQKTNPSVFFARDDIYEAIGRPNMETPDEFYQVLKTVKDKYPDIIPLQFKEIDANDINANATIASFLSGFGVSGNWLYQEGENVKYMFRDPKYVQAFKFINKLYREGIITKNQITEKTAQIDEKTNNAKYFAITNVVWNTVTSLNPTLKINLKDDKIKYKIAGIFKDQGVTPQYPALRSKGWMAALITKNAKNPERMIKFLEYAFSDEGEIDHLAGVEGLTYDIKDGVPVLKPEVAKELQTDVGKYMSKYGIGNAIVFATRQKYFDKYIRTIQFDNPELMEEQEKVNQYATDFFDLGYSDIRTDPGSNESTVSTKVNQIWSKYAIKMIMAKSDDEFDKAYGEGISEIDKAGAASVEKVYTEKHNKELELLKSVK